MAIGLKRIRTLYQLQKYQDRAEAADLPSLIMRLKRRNISETITLLNEVLASDTGIQDDELINSIHNGLLELWG